MLIPDAPRTQIYQDNLIAGLAMYMVGPQMWRIAFRIFVVFVGFLILSGAINTSMIGSTGVLMRVAEDGVLTDWFRKPHTKFGTSYRIVNLVFALRCCHHRHRATLHPRRSLRIRRHLVVHV
jgi:amino acid transporter